MYGRRRGAPAHAPRRSTRRGTALVAAGGLAALAGAVLLATAPADAEAGSSTATLTLTGVRDSNCDFQTGGTDVYVKPGGDVTFKAELAGIKVTVLGLPVELTSANISSFNDKLIVDGAVKHPHYVSDTKTYVLKNVGAGTHKIEWSANSVTVAAGLLGNLVTVPLNADTVLPASLPVGGQLNWVGSIKATNKTKCGIAIQVPGAGVTVGPIHTSIPPITDLPTLSVPDLPSLSGLPIGGGGGGGGSSHPPAHGGGGSSHPPTSGGGSGGTASPRPTSIPEIVVPNAGGGGDSAFGGGIVPVADSGGDYGPIAPIAVTSTAPVASSSPAASDRARTKPVELSTGATDDGIGGAALPVLLAIVAIIALALVTATYARMYLIRKPPAA